MTPPPAHEPAVTASAPARIDGMTRLSAPGPAGDLSYLVRPGSGRTPLLFLHPVNTAASVWADVVGALDGEWTAIALDYRAHGRSAAGGPYLPADYAADARAVLDHAGVERAHLVCGSIGGAVAVELAATAPGRVASITAYGAAVRIGWPRQTVDEVAAQLRRRGVRDWFLDHGGEVLGPDGRPEAARELAELASGDRDVETVIEVIRGTFELADSRPAAVAVSAAPPPSQVLVGSADPTCPPATARELAAYLRCDVTVLPGIGHLPMLEDPAGTAGSLRTFLRRLPVTDQE